MRRWLLAFAAAVLLSTSAAWWAPRATAWTLGRRGVFDDFSNPPTPARVLPVARSIDAAATGPGRIYALARDFRVTAHANDGSLLWHGPADLDARSIVASAEGLFVRSLGGVSAFDPDGRRRWSIGRHLGPGETPRPLIRHVVLGDAGLLYVLSDRLRGHDRVSGQEQWNIEAPIESMTRTNAGEVVVSSGNGTYLVRANGSLDRVALGGVDSAPAADGSRVILAGGTLRVVEGTSERWRVALGTGWTSGVDVLPGGTIVAAAEDLLAFHPRGFWQWRFRTAGRIIGAPVTAGPNVIYVHSLQTVAAVDPRGQLLWSYRRRGHESDPPLLLATSDGAPVFLQWHTAGGTTSRDLFVGPVAGEATR